MAEPRKRAPKATPEGRPLTEGGRVDRAQVVVQARQKEQAATQDEQGATQDEQGATQVEQGHRQDDQGATQDEQAATQVEQGHRQDDQGDALAAQAVQISAVSDGVGRLATDVATLNNGVYTKNRLDRARNRLILGAACLFLCMSAVLSVLLVRITDSARAESDRSTDRSREATAARRQLADCTTPPGTVLDNGYVNPGVCFVASARRTNAFINDAIDRLRLSMDCLHLRDEGVRPPPCVDVNNREDTLSGGGDPFRATAPLPSTSSPPASVAPATLVRPPATTPSPAPPSVPLSTSPAAPTRNVVVGLVCMILSLLGGC